MGTFKTGKEKTVIAFFALVLVVVVAMAISNPQPPGDDHDDHGHDDPAQSEVLGEKITQAKERVAAVPNNLEALIYLGDLYIEGEYLKEAIEVFHKVLKLEPDNIHALVDLGTIYQEVGFYDKSFEQYELVLKLEPDNISALYNLGMLNRYYKKDLKEALKYFQEVLSKKGVDPSISDAISQEVTSIKSEME